MATYNPTTPERLRVLGEAQHPTVLNVRRPLVAPKTEAARPATGLLDEGPLPPTVLRLPDLTARAAIASPRERMRLTISGIAQWIAIALGGLLAAWLIFGGNGSQPTIEDAPSWSPKAWAAPDGTAPTWKAAPHAGQSYETPATAPPTAPQSPRFDPFQQAQPGDGEASEQERPANEAAQSQAAAPAAVREPVYTAERPQSSSATPAIAPAQPLNVTVPVPQ